VLRPIPRYRIRRSREHRDVTDAVLGFVRGQND
jgi:hypothetical protein